MGRHVRGALGRVRPRPAMAVAGALYGVATALALLTALFAIDALLPYDPTLLQAVAVAFVPLLYDLVLAPVQPFVVGLARRDSAGAGDGNGNGTGFGDILRSGTTHYRSLLGAQVAARLAGVGYSVLLAPIVVAVALVAGTALSLALYAADLAGTPSPEYYVLALYGLAYTVWMVGILPPAFAREFALAGERPRWAWLASARAVGDHPRVATRYAIVRFAAAVAPLVVALVVAAVAPGDGSGALLAFLVALVVTAVVARTAQLTYHAGVSERIEPGLPSDDGTRRLRDALPTVRPTGRTLLAGLLVTGLVAGSAAVRVSDARPNAEAVPGTVDTDDPQALYALARARSVGVSHNATFERYSGNWSREPTPASRLRWVVEYPDRQVKLTRWPAGETTTWGRPDTVYADDGLLVAELPTRADYVISGATVDGWTVLATPYYPQVVGDTSFGAVPGADTDWERMERRDGAVVLTTTDAGAVAEWTGLDSDLVVHNETSMRVHVGPEQRIERVVVHHRFVRYRDETRTEIAQRGARRYGITFDYEHVAVSRPDGVGFRPGGFLWDLAYY